MGIKRDWRNPQDYEFTKQLTKDGWAWEFLRRNPKYIDEWKKTLVNYKIDQKKYRDDLLSKIKTLLNKGEGSVDLIPGFGKKINGNNISTEEKNLLLFIECELLKEKIPSKISSEGASSRWGFCFDELINPETDNHHYLFSVSTVS